MKRLLSLVRHHKALAVGLVIGLLTGAASRLALWPLDDALVGWCAGALTYLGISIYRMARASPDSMRQRALVTDEDRRLVLWLSLLAALISLVAVLVDLADAKVSFTPTADIAIAIFTITISWFFMQVVFTQHYAHEFWMERIGLVFPHTKVPNFWDFTYFALVIGMTYQVSDVTVSNTLFRKLIIAHAFLSFAFNTVVLALVVNLAAGLVG